MKQLAANASITAGDNTSNQLENWANELMKEETHSGSCWVLRRIIYILIK
jgi:hypothetical protein